MSRVWVALGSNMGERATNLAQAREAMQTSLGVIEAASPVYETDPVGGPAGQVRFLNQVVRIRVKAGAEADGPLAALRQLLAIEERFGRRRARTGASAQLVRWGPRPIDLDLLFWEDRVVNLPELILPHPRLPERAFVLRPLRDLDPALQHPVLGESISKLYDTLLQRDPRAEDGMELWRSPVPRQEVGGAG